ncbi:MarR family winged helix-turn-helix transcriptional regulator [Kitasatospora purpeofusca]|uniref:MarR family winged helix-turn-helix transcriptional regulator n=1 Tax=Kitasatospora purpeofusca TaxID=67352 RepID=UPI002A5A8C2B|nr:MarR family transcriptional regulator [Kitasatospora purpeofusca]MDY0813631.1 MarR family transcriptional regulator [Kitasatospora purpeofusca]
MTPPATPGTPIPGTVPTGGAAPTPGTVPSGGAAAVGEPLLIELLTLAQRRLARDLAARLEAEGCTLDQWRVMRCLTDDAGRSMGDLAQALLIPQASLSRIVDALTEAGLAYRRQDEQDRRRITAHLSRRGLVRLERLDALAAAHDAAVRTACGTTDPGRLLRHLTEV